MPEVEDEPRAAILEAASRLLAEEGPGALTVRRIATEAGGSTMNVYSRFGGKDGVIEALFREGFRRLADVMRGARTTSDPLADLRRCALRYRQFALDNPTYYSVMFDRAVPDFEPSAEANGAAAATLALLEARVQRAMDAGAIEGSSAAGIAADLWAANHGLCSLELNGLGPPTVDWASRHRETIEALLRGFTA